jgi:hypothetical protein
MHSHICIECPSRSAFSSPVQLFPRFTRFTRSSRSSTLFKTAKMKLYTTFLSIFLFAFTILALPATSSSEVAAQAQNKADLPTIWTALNKITDDLTKMNVSITEFIASGGDAIKAVSILDGATATLTDLKDNMGKVNSTEELNLITAVLVLWPVYNLNSAVDAVTVSLAAQKPLFEKASMDFIVKEKLVEFQAIAGDFIKVTLSKVPSYLGIISTPIGMWIKNKIDVAAKAYGVTGK